MNLIDSIKFIQRIQGKLTQVTSQGSELLLDGFMVGYIFSSFDEINIKHLDEIVPSIQTINLLRQENLIDINQKQQIFLQVIQKIKTKKYDQII